MVITTHRLAAFCVQEEHGASLTFQEITGLRHDLRHQTLQVVLLLEDTACQI
jgi:hypothetical protein